MGADFGIAARHAVVLFDFPAAEILGAVAIHSGARAFHGDSGHAFGRGYGDDQPAPQIAKRLSRHSKASAYAQPATSPGNARGRFVCGLFSEVLRLYDGPGNSGGLVGLADFQPDQAPFFSLGGVVAIDGKRNDVVRRGGQFEFEAGFGMIRHGPCRNEGLAVDFDLRDAGDPTHHEPAGLKLADLLRMIESADKADAFARGGNFPAGAGEVPGGLVAVASDRPSAPKSYPVWFGHGMSPEFGGSAGGGRACRIEGAGIGLYETVSNHYITKTVICGVGSIAVEIDRPQVLRSGSSDV